MERIQLLFSLKGGKINIDPMGKISLHEKMVIPEGTCLMEVVTQIGFTVH